MTGSGSSYSISGYHFTIDGQYYIKAKYGSDAERTFMSQSIDVSLTGASAGGAAGYGSTEAGPSVSRPYLCSAGGNWQASACSAYPRLVFRMSGSDPYIDCYTDADGIYPKPMTSGTAYDWGRTFEKCCDTCTFELMT